MNREILFRGFYECTNGETVIKINGVEKRGIWLYGSYCPYNWTMGGRRKNEPQIIIHDENSDNDGLWADVIPETVGQFTGLCGKNGKRIFEGDVVSDGVINYIVEFYGSAWAKRVCWASGGYSALHGNANRLTIIGNIFSNPELIGDVGNA